MTSLEEGDKLAAEVQKTPNRVTLESMEDKVKTVVYWHPMNCKHMTVAAVELENGFTLIGMSAPADPENFNLELGQKFAREDAMRQIWSLEGYVLCTRLYEGW